MTRAVQRGLWPYTDIRGGGGGQAESGKVHRNAPESVFQDGDHIAIHEGPHGITVQQQQCRPPRALVDVVHDVAVHLDESTLERE